MFTLFMFLCTKFKIFCTIKLDDQNAQKFKGKCMELGVKEVLHFSKFTGWNEGLISDAKSYGNWPNSLTSWTQVFPFPK